MRAHAESRRDKRQERLAAAVNLFEKALGDSCCFLAQVTHCVTVCSKHCAAARGHAPPIEFKTDELG